MRTENCCLPFASGKDRFLQSKLCFSLEKQVTPLSALKTHHPTICFYSAIRNSSVLRVFKLESAP